MDRLTYRERYLDREVGEIKRKGSSFQKILEKENAKKELSLREMRKARHEALPLKTLQTQRAVVYQEQQRRMQYCFAQTKKGKKKVAEAEEQLQRIIKNLKHSQGKAQAVQKKRNDVAQKLEAQREAIRGEENADIFLLLHGTAFVERDCEVQSKENEDRDVVSQLEILQDELRVSGEAESQECPFDVAQEQGEKQREHPSHTQQSAQEYVALGRREQPMASHFQDPPSYDASRCLESFAHQIEHFGHETTPLGEKLVLQMQLASGERIQLHLEKRKGRELSVTLTAHSVESRGEMLSLERSIRRDLVARGFDVARFSISMKRRSV